MMLKFIRNNKKGLNLRRVHKRDICRLKRGALFIFHNNTFI